MSINSSIVMHIVRPAIFSALKHIDELGRDAVDGSLNEAGGQRAHAQSQLHEAKADISEDGQERLLLSEASVVAHVVAVGEQREVDTMKLGRTNVMCKSKILSFWRISTSSLTNETCTEITVPLGGLNKTTANHDNTDSLLPIA